MKLIFATAFAAILAGISFAQPAQAACYSNGRVVECFHHPFHHDWRWHHEWRHDWHGERR
ncbi:MAG TPA: hypothetical protein VFA12_12400 [Stellaceae bacterium]|nr:hypothetical protein [Stellaceae bacterium]